jgi:hypothetical protein
MQLTGHGPVASAKSCSEEDFSLFAILRYLPRVFNLNENKPEFPLKQETATVSAVVTFLAHLGTISQIMRLINV